MPDPICAAVILNYNGRHLLQENLSSVVSAARKVEGGCDVIVLDNLSTDGSVEFLRENYPGVMVEVAPSNRILFSYNELCQRIRHKYVVLLNNDIRVRDDSLSVLLPHCAAPDVFAVSAVLLDAEGTTITCLFDPARKDLLWVSFIARFKERWGREPDAYAAYAYDGAQIMVNAVNRAGPNRWRIRDQVCDLDFYQGVTGWMQFDGTGSNIAPVRLVRYEHGRRVFEPESEFVPTVAQR